MPGVNQTSLSADHNVGTSEELRRGNGVESESGPTANISILQEGNETRMKRIEGWKAMDEVIAETDLRNNPEQLRALEIIAHSVIEGGPQLLMYVGGKGGTGKSYLIHAIKSLFNKLRRPNELRLGAFTGIAASLIKGNTVHSLLNLRPTSTNSGAKRLAAEWRGVNYFIIDEVSMIGAHFMATISSRLRMAKADSSIESEKYFGGINMIFLGDFHQLSPPKQPSLYAHRLIRNPNFIQTRDNRGIDAFAGAFIWRQVNTVVMLKKSKRHCNDPIFEEILERVRSNRRLIENGKPCIYAGATIIDHLRGREIPHVAKRNPEELRLFQDAPVIVGSKMIRDALNARLVAAHAAHENQIVRIFHAVDSVKGSPLPHELARKILDLPCRSTNDAIGRLPLFVGMRVMLTENLSVPFNIVNGSGGIVVDIGESTNDRRETIAEVVYVKIEGCNIKAPGLEKGVVPIFPVSNTVQHPICSGSIRAKSFRRRQIPLVPAYSYTDYKSQGRTLQRAIVDITSARGQGVYVMLSRVTSLKGLLILRWFPNSRIVQRMSGELREEIERLNSLDARTEHLHSEGMLSSRPEVPMPFDG